MLGKPPSQRHSRQELAAGLWRGREDLRERELAPPGGRCSVSACPRAADVAGDRCDRPRPRPRPGWTGPALLPGTREPPAAFAFGRAVVNAFLKSGCSDLPCQAAGKNRLPRHPQLGGARLPLSGCSPFTGVGVSCYHTPGGGEAPTSDTSLTDHSQVAPVPSPARLPSIESTGFSQDAAFVK